MDDNVGKDAEAKITEWLNRPEDGYSFTRLYDQMSGFYKVSRNICDFIVYRYPTIYYIESKATWKDRFDFSMLSEDQYNGLLEKSAIKGCKGVVIILFATYKRAFALNIKHIEQLRNNGVQSLNITKIDKWVIPYVEIQTIPNNRKKLLDYTGDLEVIEWTST